MLESLSIRTFKSLADVTVDLGTVNVPMEAARAISLKPSACCLRPQQAESTIKA